MTKQVVSGIGAVSFRAQDPAALGQRYDDHFGITRIDDTNHEPWRQAAGPTVFAPFDAHK